MLSPLNKVLLISFIVLSFMNLYAMGKLREREKSHSKPKAKHESVSSSSTVYSHDRWDTEPKDIVREFTAFTVSFDSKDDNDGDGTGEAWGIPEWVSYEVHAVSKPLGKAPERPKWFTDKELFKQKIAPDDRSYAFSKTFMKDNPDSPLLGYDRGHMCMKHIAFRLGDKADRETHILLNACPQRKELNREIWKDLEERTEHWADEFGKIWIICGPIFQNRKPTQFLGEPGEFPVAIPDAFYKIVVKENPNSPIKVDILAFIYPQLPVGGDWPKKGGKFDHTAFLVSVDEIEKETRLDFLTALDDSVENQVEAGKASGVWE